MGTEGAAAYRPGGPPVPLLPSPMGSSDPTVPLPLDPAIELGQQLFLLRTRGDFPGVDRAALRAQVIQGLVDGNKVKGTRRRRKGRGRESVHRA